MGLRRDSGEDVVLGVLSGLASALFMAFNTIYGRRGVRDYHPLTVVTYSCGFGALFWWLVMPYGLDWRSITATQWLLFGYVAVFSTVIPFLLYFLALRFVTPTSVGITACLEPVVATLAAYGALGEAMGGLQLIGSILIISAVILLQLAPPEKSLLSSGSAAPADGK